MRTPLDRIRMGAVVLGTVIVTAVLGYRLAGWSWLDSVYMVALTVSTVGYREAGPMTPGLMVFTIGVIVCGMTAATYTLGGLVQMVTEGEIDRMLGTRRTSREIERLSNHTVVCGFGRIGQMLSAQLRRHEVTLVIIEQDPKHLAEAHAQGLLTVAGDATEEDVLQAAGVERARNLVTGLPNDAANVFITLTARTLNRDLHIIARGELPSTEKKLLQAGANRVVLPAAIGAVRIANILTRPSAVELLELVAGQSRIDVEIDEIVVPPGSPLAGKSVAQTEAKRTHGLLVVAVKRGTGEMIFNPDSEFVLRAGDTLIFMAKVEDISRFRKEHGIH